MPNEPLAVNPLDNQTPPKTPEPAAPLAVAPPVPAVEPPKPVEPPVADLAKPIDPIAPLAREAIKIPEGLSIDAPVLDKFVGIMNNKELGPAAQAQALIDLQAEVAKQASEKAGQDILTMREGWKEEIRKDPTIGGEKLDPALGKISELIQTYPQATELRAMLDFTGVGDNPHLIRFLHHVAARVSEGTPAPAATPTGQPQTLNEQAARLYPTMKQGA